jgi:hypothetical protein
VQRHTAFRTFVDLSAPAVDRQHRLEIVRAGTQAVLDELAAERFQPVCVRSGDDDLAQVTE